MFVQECQTNVNVIDSLLSISTTSSPKPMTWLLAARNSSICLFARPPVLIIIEFVPYVAILKVRGCQKTSNFVKCLHSSSCISIAAGFIYSTKVCNWKVSTLGELLASNIINLILHWCRGIEIARSSYNLITWTLLIFKLVFCPKILTWLLSLKSQSLVFYFCCIILIKMFIHSVEFWGTNIERKCCWSWQASINNLFFLQFYLLIFPFNVSSDSFLLEADCSFLKIMKFVFYIGIGVLIDQMWQKFY